METCVEVFFVIVYHSLVLALAELLLGQFSVSFE
jgi:hypothetical protein